MSAPTVFISYSHQDKDLLKPLKAQLETLETAGLLEVWEDTRIDAGDKWYPEIEDAMKRAAVAVCLVSEYFLSSDFCTKQEVPFLLKRAAEEGLLIVPVLLSECVWKAHRWLKDTQMLPGEGQSVRTNFRDNPAAVFSRAANLIFEKLNDPGYAPPAPPPAWPALAPELIDLTRLPETGSALFGRDDELKQLDEAWRSVTRSAAEQIRVLVFTAHGGVGKSTLINHWLAEMAGENYRGATRVFGWSFFSQGVREENVASADSFIDAALRFFGDTDPTDGSPWDKGARLAHLVGKQRTLILLDGMEPLQSPYEFERGKLRDPALESLLRRLARESNGLCLITTREPVPDLAGRSGVVTRDLEEINTPAGRALLRTARVVGSDTELEALANRFGPHALAITLLGVYLYEQQGHGTGPAKVLEQLPGSKPIDRVLAGFEQWFGESPEREALRLLAFFDRPADNGCLSALRTAPPIPGLTDHLSNLDEAGWNRVLDRLEKLRLIHVQRSKSGKYSIDAHPLLREHFAQMLKVGDAWREGHRRLYEHLSASTKEGDQPTLEDLQPLYQAVAHGCQAGLQQDAAATVYYGRIKRRNEAYSSRKLGAFGSDLGAVACFFEQRWYLLSSALLEIWQAWLLNEAGFRLRALGRLTEALEPMTAGLNMCVKREDWEQAAIQASNLSQLELTLGEVVQALRDAEQSVTYADRIGAGFQRMVNRATHADALHRAGRLAEAETRFREAERMQQERQPEYSLLYSAPGFQYCDLLLAASERAAWQVILEGGNNPDLFGSTGVDSVADEPAQPRAPSPLRFADALQSCRAVSQRARKMFEWRLPGDPLLDVARDHLTLGRKALYEAILVSDDFRLMTSDFSHIDAAVSGLRRSGNVDELPRGLVTRAWLRFLEGKRSGSERTQEDLDEAWEIAERGQMRLFMADIHLYRARLFHAVKPYPWNKFADGTEGRGPKDDLADARKLIERCGYWRRKEELEDAEDAAKNWD
jgi:hypothetical protein